MLRAHVLIWVCVEWRYLLITRPTERPVIHTYLSLYPRARNSLTRIGEHAYRPHPWHQKNVEPPRLSRLNMSTPGILPLPDASTSLQDTGLSARGEDRQAHPAGLRTCRNGHGPQGERTEERSLISIRVQGTPHTPGLGVLGGRMGAYKVHASPSRADE